MDLTHYIISFQVTKRWKVIEDRLRWFAYELYRRLAETIVVETVITNRTSLYEDSMQFILVKTYGCSELLKFLI